MLDKVINNITRGTITTLLGSIVVLAAIVSVFIPSLNIGWPEAGAAITVGLTLILGGNK